MSWHREEFRRRAMGTIGNVAGGATKDANVILRPDWDEFWEAVDNAGDEIRVTAGDGYTLLAYSIDDGSGGAFDKANRLGRIQIDGMTAPGTAGESLSFFLYFDTSGAGAQGDASVATTIASPEQGAIDRSSPSTWVSVANTPRPGLDVPRATFGKGEDDSAFVFLDFTELLELRRTRFARRLQYEEPAVATYEVQDDGGTPQAGMIDTAFTRWLEVRGPTGRRRVFLRVRVKGGTAGDQYTLVATVLTAVPFQSGAHRTLTARVGFRVRDVLET